MQAVWTILLLIVSNVFMTFAWYGQLKLADVVPSSRDWPLALIILMSWGVALFEYSFMIPANRYGSSINGGPFSLVQLKVIQEVVSLTVFSVICITVFKTESFHWNHVVSLLFLVAAVFFAFIKY
ncbi:MAG: DMT family protein [Bacteroidales bacterium]|nr:DMT family protein [Bacteroidales bacterium]